MGTTSIRPSPAPSVAAPGGYRGPDRRRFARQPCNFDIMVHEIDEHGTVGPAHVCVCTDIAPGGVGIRSRRFYRRGTHLALIPQVPGSVHRVWFVQVVHVRYADEARYQVGGQFVCDRTDTRVLTWLMQQRPDQR